MLKLFKRAESPHWQIRGTIRGVRVRESTGTGSKAHAETILSQRQQEILDRLTFGEKHTATFGDAANLYLDLNRDDRYLEPLIRRWGMQRIAVITQLEIARAGREIYPDCKAATLMRQLYTPLIAVLNCAAHAGLCPKPAIKRPKVEHAKVSPSDDATIDTVMAAKGKIQFKLGSRGAKRQADARARLKALVLMITLTGCRISNAVDIVGRDLNLEGSEPDVIFRDTKNGDPRRVVLPPELVEALQALPKAKADERVLGYASRYTAAQAIERACDAAGVPRVSPHQIGRHTFAARLLAAGYALKTVQEAGGWKDIGIVARTYGHLERSHVDAAVRDAAGTRLTRKASNETAKVLSFKQKE